MNVTNIAVALGYAETSDFTRAFHSWSGKHPASRPQLGENDPVNCLKHSKVGGSLTTVRKCQDSVAAGVAWSRKRSAFPSR